MDMARRRIDLRLDEELLARLDAEAERLGQTRTKFVERALESALSDSPGPLNGSMRTLPDGSSERFVVGQGWVALDAPVPFAGHPPQIDAEVKRQQRAPLPPGVKSARELAMERQRKMNERKS